MQASAGVRELEKRLASVSSAATKPDELPINRLLADRFDQKLTTLLILPA